ncbi:MAG: ABC transporter permease, partial [Methylocystis sp.]
MKIIQEKNKIFDVVIPCAVFIGSLLAWEAIVNIKNIPVYILPAPSAIFTKLVEDRALLFSSLLVTLSVTLKALALATISGAGLALLLAQ